MDKSGIYFVIPAFNEENSIGKVINELLAKGYDKIIVIDDGSTDGTSKVVANYPVFLIHHIINRGQGAALGTGFEFAFNQKNCRFIVTFDADGQHRIEDVETMAELIEKSDSDIVLGSRFLWLKNESLPTSRKIMLRIAVYFLRFIYGMKITDAHNGLRIIRKEVVKKLIPATDGMLHASEILYKIKKNRLKFVESPVKINYTDYSLSKGQKNSDFIYLGILTIYHKLILLLFEKE